MGVIIVQAKFVFLLLQYNIADGKNASLKLTCITEVDVRVVQTVGIALRADAEASIPCEPLVARPVLQLDVELVVGFVVHVC